MKYFSIIIVLTCMAFSFLSAQVVGSEAQEFTLEKLGGGNISLSDYSGKVVYIFWFGNSCPNCINPNGPESQTKVADNYTTDNFQALGIDTWTNPPSTQSTVAAFQSTTSITYPLLLKGNNVASQYGVTYDRSMVIDQGGIIRYYRGSVGSSHDWVEINKVITDLLSATAIEDKTSPAIDFALKPNYPNPFNPETRIPFSINKTQNIKLQIYNISGKLVKTLVEAPFGKGNFEATWNGTDTNNNPVSSGVYFSVLQGEGISKAQQLLLIK
ncbi:MAG: T9SS C-terminal target domain-containing protein [Calditrichaeota bacterium]|nr:MAG: T9SS C-terminal target domain-containing protein [Calditrichota bacterium]MBL1205366.1 T9SS C-terminal target domain-containing protein [Calditrichota bacterium]NOG45195.1 redoxin domain-containing protein [Calditrichota bacterium]